MKKVITKHPPLRGEGDVSEILNQFQTRNAVPALNAKKEKAPKVRVQRDIARADYL